MYFYYYLNFFVKPIFYKPNNVLVRETYVIYGMVILVHSLLEWNERDIERDRWIDSIHQHIAMRLPSSVLLFSFLGEKVVHNLEPSHQLERKGIFKRIFHCFCFPLFCFFPLCPYLYTQHRLMFPWNKK